MTDGNNNMIACIPLRAPRIRSQHTPVTTPAYAPGNQPYWKRRKRNLLRIPHAQRRGRNIGVHNNIITRHDGFIMHYNTVNV